MLIIPHSLCARGVAFLGWAVQLGYNLTEKLFLASHSSEGRGQRDDGSEVAGVVVVQEKM